MASNPANLPQEEKSAFNAVLLAVPMGGKRAAGATAKLGEAPFQAANEGAAALLARCTQHRRDKPKASALMWLLISYHEGRPQAAKKRAREAAAGRCVPLCVCVCRTWPDTPAGAARPGARAGPEDAMVLDASRRRASGECLCAAEPLSARDGAPARGFPTGRAVCPNSAGARALLAARTRRARLSRLLACGCTPWLRLRPAQCSALTYPLFPHVHLCRSANEEDARARLRTSLLPYAPDVGVEEEDHVTKRQRVQPPGRAAACVHCQTARVSPPI